MKSTFVSTLIAVALAASLAPSARAQLKITEVQSAENTGTIATTADWWELSNFGASTIDLTGYKMDDNSDSFSLSVALTGITSIAAGESVVFAEGLTADQFRAWWGSGLGSSVQIGTYSGSGVGLSSSSDQVNIFDSTGTQIDGVSFSTATKGYSFVFESGDIGRSSTVLSVAGVDGAFISVNGDVGSPSVAPVPEPATIALAGLGLTALLGFRKRNRS